MGSYDLLSPYIKDLIIEKGFKEETEVQEDAIAKILSGENALIVSPTGSGKTEAAILPILDMIVKGPRRGGVSLLYISPLRALNRDLLERLEWWTKRLDIRMAVRHGDTPVEERRAQSLAPPEILITTPETLQVLLVSRNLAESLKSVKYLIIDEIHELAGDKRGSQLSMSVIRLEALTGYAIQKIGLSATIGNPEELAKFLSPNEKCAVIQVFSPKSFEYEVVYQKADDSDTGGPLFPDVVHRLKFILNHIRGKKALIFTNTRSEAESLASKVRMLEPRYPIGIHHGSLSAERRGGAEMGLKGGSIKGVICTSSLELGIDIGGLDIVIQYNSPRQVSKLIQRVGRSGHSLEQVSKGIIVVQDSDDALEALTLIKWAKVGMVEPIIIPNKPFDVMAQQLAGLVLKYGVIKETDALDMFKKSYSFRNLQKEELEELLQYMANRKPQIIGYREGAIFRPRRLSELFDFYFNNLTMIPEELNYLVVDEAHIPQGQLDESFMAEYGEIGTKFILAGSAWILTDVHKDKVYAKRTEAPEGAIPSWIGEEIPVIKEVAQDVGKLRRSLAEHISIMGKEKALAADRKELGLDGESTVNLTQEIASQMEEGLPIPSDTVLTIERAAPYIIIHSHMGLIINRTLGRVLAYRLSEAINREVKIKNDAYRIVLETEGGSSALVTDILRDLEHEDIEPLIINSCINTGIFRRRLIQAARKMGVVQKGARVTLQDAQLLSATLQGTVIYKEAVRTMMEEDLDPRGLIDFVRGIHGKTVELKDLGERRSPSPLAMIGLEEMARQGEVINPSRLKRLLIEAAKARVEGCYKYLYCSSCGNFQTVAVSDMGDPPVCEKCGSSAITLMDSTINMEYSLHVRSSDRVKKEAEMASAVIKKYGKKGAIAMCFDIPFKRIPEVIEGREDDDLYLALINAERKRF